MHAKFVIEDLLVNASIGVLAEEKKKLQPLYITVKYGLDIHQSMKSDALADTIDYAMLCKRIQKLVHTKHFNLIEHLAYELAKALYAIETFSELEIIISKPQAIAAAKSIVLHFFPKASDFTDLQSG